MKIAKKNPISSNTQIGDKGYTSAVNKIQSAIDDLGLIADNDPKAQDAIANLSVVLFELKD